MAYNESISAPTPQSVGMDKPDAVSLMRRHSEMVAARSNYNQQWQEIARQVWPDRAIFTTIKTPGIKVNDYIFDATAPLALPRFAAALESILTPRTSQWHKMRARRKDLRGNDEVKRYMDDINNLLFEVRYGPSGNFASQMNECYMSVGSFGPACLYVPDIPGGTIKYKAIPINEMYLLEDQNYCIDTFHREYQFTARQAMHQWGNSPDATIPSRIKEIVKSRPDQIFNFVEIVMPRADTGYGTKDKKHMPWACYDICKDTTEIIEESGYSTCPYCVGRHMTTPGTGLSTGHVYGYSPAQLVLPDIKSLNEMNKEALRSSALKNLPPLLLPDSDILQAFQMRPGSLNFGGVDDQGRPMVIPLNIGSDIQHANEMMEQKRRSINDSFLVTLFQILIEAPQMTATEALLRAQEKGQLLAPMLRLYSEMLGPLVQRELDILSRAGALPKPPDELIEAGLEYEIEYVSPLIRMQRSEEGVAIMRTLEAMGSIAQFDPSIAGMVDYENTLREIADINGAPAKMLKTKDEIAGLKQAQAEQAQMQNILNAAPVAAQTAKTMAEAQNIGGQGMPTFSGR